MKKAVSIGIFAVVIVLIVAIIVFSSGNNQAPPQNLGTNNPPANSQDNVQNPEPTDSQNNQDTTQPADKVSRGELALHNAQEDCWISYNKDVFDVTDWLPRHPGSAAAIAPYCGTAEEFENAFTGQHGTSQVQKLTQEGIYKGELE